MPRDTWKYKELTPPVSDGPEQEAIRGETCDRCACPAVHVVYVTYQNRGRARLGALMFCRYHYGMYQAGMMARGVWVP